MRRIVSAVAVVMLVVALAPAASATESRSQSLLYNLAFEDQTDVFLFPQLLPVYEGAYFHLPVNNPGGVFGGLILGLGDGALGVFIHRPVGSAFDQYRIAVTDDPGLISTGVIGGNPSAAVAPHISGQIFDIMYGARSWGVGLRMHLFSDISVQYPPLADGNPGTARFAGELNAGFNFSPGFDMRINAGLVHDEDVSNLILFRVGLRYLEASEKRMRLVIGTELQVGFLVPDGDVDTSIGFALPFKGGVLFSAIPGKLQFSLLGGIDIQMLKILDEDMRFGIAFPTLELAGEWQALSWMHVRTAIKGGWGILMATPADQNPKYEQMVFSSGVGFPLGPFCLDAVIQYSFWNNGPWFLSGNGGLFAGVSLSYRWGDGAPGPSGGSSAGSDDGWGTPKAAKPRPVVKPKPKPKPAPPPAEEKPPPAEEKPPEEKKDSSFEGWEEE